MIRKTIIVSIFVSCIILLTGCIQSMKYPKYEIEKQDNGQYILTSPDGISYVTYENLIWFPEMPFDVGFNFEDAIGKCDDGYIFVTPSEVYLFLTGYHERNQNFFILEGTVLPELSIENINNAVLVSIGERESQIIVDKKMTGELIELYNNSEIHEIKEKDSIGRIWKLYIVCEQLEELFFRIDIYTDGIEYYMGISRQYDNHANLVSIVCSKCTSEMEAILEKN